MKIWEVEFETNVSTLTLDAGEWVASSPPFPHSHWIGWVDPRDRLGAVDKRKLGLNLTLTPWPSDLCSVIMVT
jgi:hypothetical protein